MPVSEPTLEELNNIREHLSVIAESGDEIAKKKLHAINLQIKRIEVQTVSN